MFTSIGFFKFEANQINPEKTTNENFAVHFIIHHLDRRN